MIVTVPSWSQTKLFVFKKVREVAKIGPRLEKGISESRVKSLNFVCTASWQAQKNMKPRKGNESNCLL